MRRTVKILLTVSAALVLTMTGCGKSQEKVEVTPTPAPTATPVPATPTAVPSPTVTPSPRMIGVKTSQSRFVYLTNRTGKNLREIYVKVYGGEDWGKNLIPSESSVKASEQVCMYYTPVESSAEEAIYDIKVSDEDGKTYEIYGADLSDMEKTDLKVSEGTAYLQYMSVSEKKEKTTRDNQAYENGDSEEDYSESSDDETYSYDDYYIYSEEDNGYVEEDYYDENTEYDDGSDYDDGYSEDYDGDAGYVEEEDTDYDSEVVWDADGNWSEE